MATKLADGQTILVEPELSLIKHARINLPEVVIDKQKIGLNTVFQKGDKQREIEVAIYHFAPKTFKLTTQEGEELYLAFPGSKADLKGKTALIARGVHDPALIDEDTRLSWLSNPQLSHTKNPDDILKSWEDLFVFQKGSADGTKPGFRKPQLGGIHATAAHLSVSNEPSTVVMPTGTGKTDTTIASYVHQQFKRLLVLVPTRPLREQTFNKFVSLGELKTLGAIPKDTLNPRVSIIEHGVNNVVEAKALLKESNVVIATVQAISKSPEDVKKVFQDEFSHLVIDEAHHAPASSWQTMIDLFPDKPILQYTATPFRNDGKRIEGDIIYNYPLGMAQEEGYFKRINLVKLQEFDDSKADEMIAQAAIKALEDDLGEPNKFDHIIMARCESKDHAKDVLAIYERLGSKYSPLMITSETNGKDYRAAKEALESSKSRIVVCVNMLGEGYDLPNLKIAALHDAHKSLAVTLQFIGRFTRTAKNVGDATVVINVNEPKVNKDLEALYSEDPDWNEVLRQKSESKIESEIESHEFIKEFKGELSKHISLWNLRPSFSAFIYKTSSKTWEPEKFIDVMPKSYSYWHAINSKEQILVFVVSKEDEVKWGKYKDIHNHSFELYVVHFDEAKKALYIYGSDYDAVNMDGLAKALCGDDTEVKNGQKVFNIFSGVERTLARNVGISTTGNISYTMHFGSDITQGLSRVDKGTGVLNNISAWGYEKGERFAAGASVKSGKIWSIGGAPILVWKEWCQRMAEKIFNNSIKESEIVRDFLKPKSLKKRYKAIPISVQWGEGILQSQEENVTVFIGKDEYKLYDVNIDISEFTDNGPVKFKIYSETTQAEYKIDYSADKATYSLTKGKGVSIKRRSGVALKLEEYMTKDPITIFYIDGTFSYNNMHVPTPKLSTFYQSDQIVANDWSSTDITVESMRKEVRKNSIQYKVFKDIEDDYDVIFNDDASGEAADLISIRQESDDTIRLHLIHAKFSSSKSAGSRIGDFYEVCGQAQKSIRWKHNGFEYLANHMKKREASWQASGNSRFLKGSLADLNRLKKLSRYAKKFIFEVTIVQPGLSKKAISTDIIQLLGSTEDYLQKTSGAIFNVISSK